MSIIHPVEMQAAISYEGTLLVQAIVCTELFASGMHFEGYDLLQLSFSKMANSSILLMLPPHDTHAFAEMVQALVGQHVQPGSLEER